MDEIGRAILAAMGLLAVGWMTWITRAASQAMSRSEHAHICEQRDKDTKASLAEIKQMLVEQNRMATKSRHTMNQRIQEVCLTLAAKGLRIRSLPEENEDTEG